MIAYEILRLIPFSCETCHYWFHFECVGVTHSDECVIREDVPYYCPTCYRPTKLPDSLQRSQDRSSRSSSKNSRKRKNLASKDVAPYRTMVSGVNISLHIYIRVRVNGGGETVAFLY